MNHATRGILSLFIWSVAFLALSATPGLGAPELDVSLEYDSGSFATVSHSDERVDFTVRVKNVAPTLGALNEGDPLSCTTTVDAGANSLHWSNGTNINYSFEFRWFRDGMPATGWQPPDRVIGEPKGDIRQTVVNTYSVQAADGGQALQCLVRGTNGAGTGSDAVASLPAVVVDPQPAVAPPGPNGLESNLRRPEISGTVSENGDTLTCVAPVAGWSESNEDSAISWSFQWLRDGEEAPGAVTPLSATESEYELTAEDVSAPVAPVVFQCIVTATNSEHSVVVESAGIPSTSPAPMFESGTEAAEPDPGRNHVPLVEPSANTTFDPVTIELELPAGEETFAYKVEPGSLNCEKRSSSGGQPARVRCHPGDLLRPGEELPALEVIAALGSDAPDLPNVKATAFGGGAEPASDEIAFPIEPAIPFGVFDFTAFLLDQAGEGHVQAGGHPFDLESDLVLNKKRQLVGGEVGPIEELKEVTVDGPPGLVGNPLAFPMLCPGVEELLKVECPAGSAVGVIDVLLAGVGSLSPIFAIEPEFGAPAQLAFTETAGNVFVLTPRLRAGNDGYTVGLDVAAAPEKAILESSVVLCGYGVDLSVLSLDSCKEREDAGANPTPFFTAPTLCGVPLETRVQLNSWSDPTFVEGPPFASAPMEGCDKVPFEPTVGLEPSSDDADSGTGLDVEVSMPTDGLEDPEGISQSHLRKAEVTLPEGMAVNPSAGHGLGACEEDEIKLGTDEPISCPDASKIGSVEIETPVIEDTLKGAVYIAEQGAVDGSLIGFYMVFDSPKNGILVKLPAKVTPDPQTGQLVVTVEDSPQQPFSAVRMHFPGGDRATLLTPPECGTYEIEAKLTPWSGGKAVTQTSEFEVDEGPDGGPCPDGSLAPGFAAGAANPLAGATSPFNVHLTRPDGSQRFSALDLAMPPGLTAYLKGIPYCPEGVLASISAELGTGQDEIDDPSCPAASGLGRIVAGAGAGDTPFFVDTGRAYLAGPYKGAPLSIVAVVPAVAGPLDLGSVVVRNAVHINPETAQVRVVSDRIPTIRHGILLDVRDVRVLIDRPAFTLNPTSCAAKQVAANVLGDRGALASVANHFQVGGCGALDFKPRLYTRLFGGTKRGAFPRFRAVLKAGAGEANIARTVVTIPRSEFIEQGHFRTICTRVQFAADACPKGSVYGRVKAFSPLVDYPLEGPVRLRSSDNELPDLVMTVHGPPHQPIEATAVARIDSVRGQLRATIAGFPDVPVSKAIVMMQGGQKGLLVNSRDICRSRNRATVNMRGQNGKLQRLRPVLNNSKCKRRAGKRRARR